VLNKERTSRMEMGRQPQIQLHFYTKETSTMKEDYWLQAKDHQEWK
jgi:hypothetical protein